MQGERLDIQIPQDDGMIVQALTDLDAKMAAWSDAMRAAELRLSDLAESCRRQSLGAQSCQEDQAVPDQIGSAPSTVVDDGSSVEPLEPDTDLDTSVDADTADAELMSHQQVQESTAVLAEPEPVVEDDSEQVHSEINLVEQVVEKADPMAQDAGDSDQDSSSGDAGEDNEALLASLDAETAKAIRVMRRLAPSKASVRELLAEYEATKANKPVEQPKKKSKSWFRS